MKPIAANATLQTIAVDLAKEVFQLACADANFRIRWVLGGLHKKPATITAKKAGGIIGSNLAKPIMSKR